MIGRRLFEATAATRSLLFRSGIIVTLLLTFTAAASAYTLVFRNGNRMEIPDEFTVSKTTLTYEISPGFQKTILLSLVDIGATERANNEPWGSFHKRRQLPAAYRAKQSEPAPTTYSSPTPATRTVTNDDLKAIRARRIESEQAYEYRRQQLGLPTVAETRRQREMDANALRDEWRNRAAGAKQEEAQWRSRARELRTEIAMVDRQINYAQARLNEINESSRYSGSWTNEYPIYRDYPWSRNGRWGRNRPQVNPPIFGPQYPNGYPQGRYPNFPNGRNPGYPNRYPGYPGQYPGYPGQYPGYPGQYPGYPGQYPGYPGQYPGYPGTYPPYGYPGTYGYPDVYGNPGLNPDLSGQHADLTRRLDDLLMQRAGLLAQWQALEDEARDARIPQAWLEP
jgi:hypothetical protein